MWFAIGGTETQTIEELEPETGFEFFDLVERFRSLKPLAPTPVPLCPPRHASFQKRSHGNDRQREALPTISVKPQTPSYGQHRNHCSCGSPGRLRHERAESTRAQPRSDEKMQPKTRAVGY
jgi:hypothetical protein